MNSHTKKIAILASLAITLSVAATLRAETAWAQTVGQGNGGGSAKDFAPGQKKIGGSTITGP